MTIKIEQEALLRFLSREPSYPLARCEDPIPDDGDEFVLVDIPKPLKSFADSFCDDERSLCTLSTDSLSTDSDDDSLERRVSFAAPLITDEWTRPKTPREDIKSLYYSTEDTTRFRQEYRLERKVLNELSVDPDSVAVGSEDLSKLVATTACPSASRHSISHVVIVHNDKLETFFQSEESSNDFQEEQDLGEFFDNDSFWSGSLTWY